MRSRFAKLLVEYATYNLNGPLFVKKYQLYLPDREELRRELEQTLREAGLSSSSLRAMI